MECGICLTPFDALQRRPKCLPCGHSFCMLCLQDNNFNKICPLDRKVIIQAIAELPDNFQLLALIDEPIPKISAPAAASTARRRLWCKTCSKEAPDSCLDADHDVCSLRKARSLEMQDYLQNLQQEQMSLQELHKELDELRFDQRMVIVVEVGKVQDLLQQNAAAQKKIQEALDGPSDAWEEAKQDAARQADLVASATKTLSVMQDSNLSCTVTVTKGSHSSTVTWQLDQLAQSDATLNRRIRYVLHQLLEKEKLPVFEDQSIMENLSLSTLNISDLSKCGPNEKVEEKSALLASGHLNEVRIRLRCDIDPFWSLRVLDAAKNNVEELELTEFTSQLHLSALSALCSLRRLYLIESRSRGIDLAFRFPSKNRVSGLKFLRVYLSNESSILSLCTANKESLEVLEITECSFLTMHMGKYYYLPVNVAIQLRNCGLQRLKKLVFRWVGSHDNMLCYGRRASMWKYLRDIKVLCGTCDKC